MVVQGIGPKGAGVVANGLRFLEAEKQELEKKRREEAAKNESEAPPQKHVDRPPESEQLQWIRKNLFRNTTDGADVSVLTLRVGAQVA